MLPDESKPQVPAVTQTAQVSPNGRTAWDFATEAIRSRTAMLLVVLLTFVLPLTIHFVAEPGSEVSVFNLIKYKKAAERVPPPDLTPVVPVAVPASSPATLPNNFYLPTKIKVRDEAITPILDRAINVQAKKEETGKTTCRLGGANLPTLRAAIRQLNGNSAKLESSGTGGPVEATLENGCYLEIEYRSFTFSIELVDIGYPNYELTVARQVKPTLTLASPPAK
ncbi:hypothetical protein RA210_U470008 [Rubrivivax sp. A210]|nr:hypothetical protein RA210_U470008 [Rubrivivax sp. A210]